MQLGQLQEENMLIRKPTMLTEADVTDAGIFKNRRNLIKAMMALGLGQALPSFAGDKTLLGKQDCESEAYCLNSTVTATPVEMVKNYTNYYEFAYNKTEATHAAQLLPTRPWTIEVSGEVEKPVDRFPVG